MKLDTMAQYVGKSTPEYLASTLLTEHKGVQRNAEANVWSVFDQIDRSNEENKGAVSFLTQTVKCICRLDGFKENPEIERVDPNAVTRPVEVAPEPVPVPEPAAAD